MIYFLKRCAYTMILICMALALSFAFSFAKINALWFYLFFLTIGAFLGGFKTLWLSLAAAAAGFAIFGNAAQWVQAGLCLAFVCLYKNRLAVWLSIAAGYLSAAVIMLIWFLFTGRAPTAVLEEWHIYLTDAVLAMPFVYALIRGGIVPGRIKNKKQGIIKQKRREQI